MSSVLTDFCCLLLIKSVEVDNKSSLNNCFLVVVNIPCHLLVCFLFLLTWQCFKQVGEHALY